MNLLFEELQAERIAGRYIKYIRKLTSAKALILDDFGLRSYTHAEASSLLEVLEERYSKGVTIITSQVLPKGWISLFEDPVIAEAIVDRLCNPAQIVSLVGDSYRKKRK
jgi:DNA replication protein DnaC